MMATWLNPFSNTPAVCRARRGFMEGPVANVEMARAWDGADGEEWAGIADERDRELARHHAALMSAAAVAADERVLDIGCGNGQTTIAAATAATAGSALGVDLSSAMLERARERARAGGLRNVAFV